MTSELISEEKKDAVEVVSRVEASSFKKTPRVTRFWLWLNIVLIVLIFLIVGASVGFYYAKVQQMTKAVDQLQKQTMKVEQSYAIEEATLNVLQKTVSEQDFRLQQQHQSLRRLALFEQQRQWRLDEIRYLINLANTSLLFSHDVKTAHQLLEQVHASILSLHDTTLDILDQAVQSDMQMLAAMTLQDAAQVFLQVTSVDQELDDMPLLGSGFSKEDVSPDDLAPEEEPTWRTRLKQTLRELKYFVVIRKTSDSLSPLVAQEQGEYINQYLHMQLGQAQWAVLRNDNVIYQASLKQASLWVSRYFVVLNPTTQDVLSALNALQEIDVSFPGVTLDKTVNALVTLTNN